MNKIIAILVLVLVVFSCGEDKDDTLTPGQSNVAITFKFSHNWDNTVINSSSIISEIVTNAHGENMNIARLRYLVSRFQLTHENGTVYNFEGYKFTNLSDESTYNFTPENNGIPKGRYTLNFIWGFNELDNIEGGYPELNSVSWNWPAMLGGGYHFLQFDGSYNLDTTAKPFNFHNGTARVSTNVFEQNFAEIALPTPLNIIDNATIEIKMNLAEFFKNPHTWDLNVMDTSLMPNYDAQKMMQANVQSVFSIGTLTF